MISRQDSIAYQVIGRSTAPVIPDKVRVIKVVLPQRWGENIMVSSAAG